MKCNICGADVTYVDSHQHTTSLRNHIQNYHRDKLETSQPPKVAKIDDYFRENPTRLPTKIGKKFHSESQIWRQNGGKEYYLDFPGIL